MEAKKAKIGTGQQMNAKIFHWGPKK